MAALIVLNHYPCLSFRISYVVGIGKCGQSGKIPLVNGLELITQFCFYLIVPILHSLVVRIHFQVVVIIIFGGWLRLVL